MGETLGGDVVRDEGWSHVENVSGLPFEAIVFQPVPEDKTTKNRIHIDVTTDDVGALVVAGATAVREKGDGGIGWTSWPTRRQRVLRLHARLTSSPGAAGRRPSEEDRLAARARGPGW